MKNTQEGKVLVHVLRLLVSLFVYLIVLPSVVVFIGYYIKLVPSGKMFFKDYIYHYQDYSYRPVIDFYGNVINEAKEFIDRLRHTRIIEK